jgi:histidinol phosphatase-like enzyme (inositol monophosphatase family)
MQTLEAISQQATDIAKRASTIALQHFRVSGLDIIEKADESPVTIADRATETFIRKELTKAFPDHGILGEEFGTSGNLDEKCWIIDPIDGTRFFITGYPAFGMLLAYLEGGQPKLGIVQMPALGETFVGLEGGAATLNGAIIQSSNVSRLSDAKIFINEAERTFSDAPKRFERLCNAGHTRRISYDCYPHAMVAAGRIDAVTDMGLEPYDFLPLVTLIKAAGGVISDWNGKPLSMKSEGRVLTSATPKLHEEMLELLAD